MAASAFLINPIGYINLFIQCAVWVGMVVFIAGTLWAKFGLKAINENSTLIGIIAAWGLVAIFSVFYSVWVIFFT